MCCKHESWDEIMLLCAVQCSHLKHAVNLQGPIHRIVTKRNYSRHEFGYVTSSLHYEVRESYCNGEQDYNRLNCGPSRGVTGFRHPENTPIF
jgi:hypothetical protein